MGVALFVGLFTRSSHSQEINYLTATVADVLTLLDAGIVTSEALVNAYLSRIEENNHQGLLLRGVLETAPYESIIQIAKDLDSQRKQGNIVGPLHGVPILVKDNIATNVTLGMNTTAGNYGLRNFLFYGIDV